MFSAYLVEAMQKSATTVLTLAIILIAIMIVIEYANHFQLLEKSASFVAWLPRSLGMSPNAAFPMIVGMFLGVLYGAAVIIEYTKQETLTKRDITLCGVFLAINHGIIEDNLLLAALGANLLIIFPLRFVMAFIITRSVAYILDKKAETLHVKATE